MGIEWSVEAKTRLVRLTLSDAVTLEEWAETLMAVFDDPGYKPSFHFLLDWRLALTPDVHFITRAVAFTREHKHQVARSRWAMVVADLRMFGLMRLAKDLSADVVKGSWVFHDIKEAEHWLRSA